jgi:DNA (cytosine-5)-methyltransferase 3A
LRDILEDEVDRKYYISKSVAEKLLNIKARINADKSYCISTMQRSSKRQMTLISTKGIERKEQNKSSCLTGAGGHGMENHSYMDMVVQLNKNTESNGRQPYQQNRVYDINAKSPALMAEMSCGSHTILSGTVRRLTPTECARLQTIPAWYKWKCSDKQIYKMLGNGWTIEVIKHILSYLPERFFKPIKYKQNGIN